MYPDSPENAIASWQHTLVATHSSLSVAVIGLRLPRVALLDKEWTARMVHPLSIR